MMFVSLHAWQRGELNVPALFGPWIKRVALPGRMGSHIDGTRDAVIFFLWAGSFAKFNIHII